MMLTPAASREARAIAIVRTLVLVGAATILGCSLTRPTPVKGTFMLEPAPIPVSATTKPVSLRIGAINVAAPYRGRAFIYRTAERTYETDYYQEFLVAPSAMLSEATARSLGGAQIFRRVYPPGVAAADANLVLDGFVSVLHADSRDPGKPAAVIAVTFFVSGGSAGPGDVVFSRAYEARVAMNESTPVDLVRAWSEALRVVLADLARDLAAAPLAGG